MSANSDGRWLVRDWCIWRVSLLVLLAAFLLAMGATLLSTATSARHQFTLPSLAANYALFISMVAGVGPFFFFILGNHLIAQERTWSTFDVTTTAPITPAIWTIHRTRLMALCAVAVTLLAAATAVVLTAFGVVPNSVPKAIVNSPDAASMAISTFVFILGSVLWGMIGTLTGLLFRRTLVATTLTIAYVFLETLAVQDSGINLAKYLPVNAQASTLQWISYISGSAISPPELSHALPPGVDMLVLSCWVAASVLLVRAFAGRTAFDRERRH